MGFVSSDVGDAGRSVVIDLVLGRDPSGHGSLAPTVRRCVRDVCMRVLGDADVTSRVVVATYELLDNALRYGAGDARLRVVLSREEGAAVVHVATTNRAEPAHVAVLEHALVELAAGPAVRYEAALALARRGVEAPLGLARVQAEAELSVTGHLADGHVAIAAVGRFR